MAFQLSIDDVPDHDVARTLARTLRRVSDDPGGLRAMPDGRAGSGTILDGRGRVVGNWTFIPDVDDPTPPSTDPQDLVRRVESMLFEEK